jgi:hypothetical protein
MTSSENISASTRSVYDTCDPDYLRQLRQASGVEETWLARTACLSLSQVRQLEEGGESLFYSPTIKRQAYKRLLMILGAEPPSAIVDVVAQPEPSVVHDLNEIIAMGEKNLNHRSWTDVLLAVRTRLSEHKISAAVVACLAVAAVSSWVVPLPGAEPMVVAEAQPAKAPESLTLAALPSTVSPAWPAASVAVVPPRAPEPASSSAATACQYSRETWPQISPQAATKSSRYVYMVAAADVTVCVVDGNQQASLLTLKAGESQSVFGVAPLQVSSAKLGKIQIYFQGWRVALPEAVDQRVTLIEKSN